MSFFDQVYQKLFNKPVKGLVLHEVLKRTPAYRYRYSIWKNSEALDELLNNIATSLKLKDEGITKHPEVHRFSGNYSNGIAISYHSDIDKEHFHFLFDLFSERVQELGYKVSVSDLMVTEKKEYVEFKEKHYLKSRLSRVQPIDQKFGNIIIELIMIDDYPSHIRLLAHAYNDRLYKSPDKFEDLAKYLLSTEEKK